jgi:hypothetical protein
MTAAAKKLYNVSLRPHVKAWTLVKIDSHQKREAAPWAGPQSISMHVRN